MNKYKIAALSVCGGVLSGLAWTDWCHGFILLIGFVPFIYIEDYLYENNTDYSPHAFFLYLLPGFVIFSILTLGWIRSVSITAALCVILSSGFLMSFTLWLAHIIRLKEKTSLIYYVSLIAFWLTFEFFCLRALVLSPWINLGNGLSKNIMFIQWYEVTGTAGGTLWILLSNLFLFLFLNNLFVKGRTMIVYLTVWIVIVILPSAFSVARYNTIKTSSLNGTEAVIVQPNFDPFGEKFTIPFEKQLEKALSMAGSEVTENTVWLVMPETLVDDPADETRLSDNKYITMIRAFAGKNPSVTIVTGMVSFISPSGDGRTAPNIWKDQQISVVDNKYFNSAIKIDTSAEIEIYHKSRLVPGFEFIPEEGILRIITRILPDLGGKNRGYSIQEKRTCFVNSVSLQKVVPVICYESVFGEYLTDAIKQGAVAIFIITNDGWWKNTSGYKQHFSVASLRAIETRRPVIRAANTGISCFIDIRGKATSKTTWWKSETIKGIIYPENRITPYVKYGDFLMKLALTLSIIILLSVFCIKPILKKRGKSD